MNSIAGWGAATAVAVTMLSYPQNSSAEAFTGEAFLTWSEDAKRGYIDAQLVMASSIAARIKPEMSQCLASAFYGAHGLTDDGYELVIGGIADFPGYHPSSVLVVLIENACGGFN